MVFEEHRYHSRLRQYWDRLRGSRPFPAENDISPEELDDIWDSCFLISLDDVTRRIGYRYSYLGQHLVEAYGADGGNADISRKLTPTEDTPMRRQFDKAVETRQPVTDEDCFLNMKQVPIRYRTCILPLGTEKGEVTHLLGCMRWRMY